MGGNNGGQATGTPNPVAPLSELDKVSLSGRTLTNITAISAGNDYSLALRQDGRVVAWGVNRWGTTAVPSSLASVVAISAGDDFCLAITTNKSFDGKGVTH
jgi:alpha-tubulin suppressor-like RCC1 family protein